MMSNEITELNCLLATFCSLVLCVLGLNNSLARTPPLGWMSWGYYQCGDNCNANPEKCLNEELIMSVADELSSSGYLEAGYEYVVVDDCWSELQRNLQGKLVPNYVRFPRGIKFLADYVHSRGLKFGLYGSAGSTTCMGYPGTRGHLQEDAESFAEWGVDYVKFDGCFVNENDLNSVYINFGKELNKTGRPMVYSCSWPYYIEFIHHTVPDYERIAATCNLWRNYHDIFLHWGNVVDIIRHYEQQYERMASYMGPGHWNDPDMVIVGSAALTPGQSRVQLAVWAMLSAPLLLSCDLTRTKKWERDLLVNPHLLAIDQDPLGTQAVPYKMLSGVTLWVKRQTPLKGDREPSYSLAFVNLTPRRISASFKPQQYHMNNNDGYTVMDVFSGVPLRNVTIDCVTDVTVPVEDVILYTLFPL